MELGISSGEIAKSMEKIHISLADLCIRLRKIHICFEEIYKFFSPTTQPAHVSERVGPKQRRRARGLGAKPVSNVARRLNVRTQVPSVGALGFREVLPMIHAFQADETGRRQLPSDPTPRPGGDETGPSKPSVKRPDSKNILDRMKRVDPDQAKRYRQRSGQ